MVLGLLVGCEHIDEINHRLRPDKVLLNAFGYTSCADQSVIQDTLDGCVKANVVQLKGVLRSLYLEHNQSQSLLAKAIEQSKTIVIDMDLTGRPVSQNAEGAKKGYFSGRRGIYGRQLARVLVPNTKEIIAEELYPGNRARVLAQSVENWVDMPADSDGPRQVGWVKKPHRYGRKTRQLAIRKPNKKKKGGYTYVVLVITDMKADLFTLLRSYDARSGVPESSFCQDNQGLAQRKLRKHQFAAQQMLVLLSQLTHNLIRWVQRWMVDALATKDKMEQDAQQMMNSDSSETKENPTSSEAIRLTMNSIEQRGIRRWVRQLFALDGVVIIKRGVVTGLTLNANYPLVDRFQLAFEALLRACLKRVSEDDILRV